MTSSQLKKKFSFNFININLNSELNNLDTLTEFFSFFTEFDTSVSRQTCKWWDGLLKDPYTLKIMSKSWKRNSWYIQSYIPTHGKIPLPMYIDKDSKKDYFENKLVQAPYFGYLDLVTWSIKDTPTLFRDKGSSYSIQNYGCMILSSILGDHLKILKFLKKDEMMKGMWKIFLNLNLTYEIVFQGVDHISWGKKIATIASAVGNLKILNYLKNGNFIFYFTQPFPSSSAASRGHIHVLKWIYNNSVLTKTIDPTVVSKSAAKGGHRHVLEWLIQKGLHVDDELWVYAASEGHFELLKWLIKEKVCNFQGERHLSRRIWNYRNFQKDELFSRAIEGGNLDMVIWIYHEFKPTIYLQHGETAAYHGHLNILKWLFSPKISCPIGDMYENAVIKIGKTKIPTLEWISKNLYKVNDPERNDSDIWIRALRNGDMEVLHWLSLNGLPLPVSDIKISIAIRKVEVFEYMCDKYPNRLQPVIFVQEIKEIITFLTSRGYQEVESDEIENGLAREVKFLEGIWMKK